MAQLKKNSSQCAVVRLSK